MPPFALILLLQGVQSALLRTPGSGGDARLLTPRKRGVAVRTFAAAGRRSVGAAGRRLATTKASSCYTASLRSRGTSQYRRC